MNILYIDIDSLRRDHLGCYGYHRDTSPTIDRIAAEGMRFENVYVSDVPCHPSRTALWSGRHGLVTGVVGHGGTACEPFREGAERAWAGTFYEDGWMKCLRDLGYHTATFSSFGERHGCWHWYAGFNEVHNCGKRGMETADEVIPQATDWLERRGRDGKWFLHVNLWDPHTPYRTPRSYGDPFAKEPLPAWMTADVVERAKRGYGPHSALEPNGYGRESMQHWWRAPDPIDGLDKAAAWINGYDAGVRYADDHIARLLGTLDRLGLTDETIVMVSADHGENLGELNIWADHQTADQFTCNTPLVVRWPGVFQAGSVNRGLHYHFDWAATLVDKLGGKVPARWNGRSFASALAAGEEGGRDFLVTSQGAWAAQRGVRFRHAGKDWLMMRTYHDGYKDIGPFSLFDLTSDPHEEHDVAEREPAIVDHAMRLLDEWRGTVMAESGQTVDPLMTVIAEGGPFHCRGELKAYLERLRATGRGDHADALAARHPREVDIQAAGDIAIV
jgi:arylsulfatase A-like enzyme